MMGWGGVFSRGIENLNGIEAFINLDTLICYANDITEFNIKDLEKLKKLDCRSNLLTSLDVTKNIALTQLICSHNEIAQLLSE